MVGPLRTVLSSRAVGASTIAAPSAVVVVVFVNTLVVVFAVLGGCGRDEDDSSSSSSWIKLGAATSGSTSGRHLRDFLDVIVIMVLAGEEKELKSANLLLRSSPPHAYRPLYEFSFPVEESKWHSNGLNMNNHIAAGAQLV